MVSDEDYVGGSDDDVDIGGSSNRDALAGTRSKSTRANKESSGFEVTRTWENLTEGADGTITGAVEGLLQAGKRQRLLKDTTPLQRGIIRHVILILDLSIAMQEKDLRPTRYHLTIRYASSFVSEFFEQNPISQLGIIGMRDGLAVRISNMSGNPNDHISSLHELRKQEPRGQPSLENALEMARASLFHAPTHGTREVLLVFGALHTVDPNDIHLTIANLVKDKIRARVIGLAAQVAICAELVTKTNNGDRSNYTIVLHEQHFPYGQRVRRNSFSLHLSTQHSYRTTQQQQQQQQHPDSRKLEQNARAPHFSTAANPVDYSTQFRLHAGIWRAHHPHLSGDCGCDDEALMISQLPSGSSDGRRENNDGRVRWERERKSERGGYERLITRSACLLQRGRWETGE
ncbi:hypothetical protein EPUS_01262 [Endocarpon pusillum Z07020]|uniref:VWFA domain-containing protein n=1 Tax=Endocarpon pusillum (strain Z07020 / HMAS-L-300199) TaxID=1263415 RepID=U1GV22_ENDPU|nr:uncharacterized protein EPUS_01262 [Endocarpon pusillum Z07020]ERF75896.1 hypothetical protein EPUS_01262 [Endocarpon pusillum Z07020]